MTMVHTLEKKDSIRSAFPPLASFFPDLRSWSVGFEREWDMMEELQDAFDRGFPAYPPYNIKKINDHKYEIDLAVAGFTKDELSVEVADKQIMIEGNKNTKEEANENNYIYKGIASQHFHQSFALADHLEVKKTEFKNGILKLTLEGQSPEIGKTKKIAID